MSRFADTMSDPLKNIKDLFPDMEAYVPDPKDIQEGAIEEPISNEEKAKMRLYVLRDKKHRGGKQVTLVQGFEGSAKAMKKLHSELKSICSAGGSIKDGELMIQGNHIEKVIHYLLKSGYNKVKQKGG